ncbi:uncharacterized protein LOC132311618 [Cornus florida]|uniref:uncharacterized protein LOC132311618 n=1 Tax=Cornus florida TaxID=4283 RepID=UPI00289F51C5|nr:uncharacterized protein LOC132311618 [Cornus florida]
MASLFPKSPNGLISTAFMAIGSSALLISRRPKRGKGGGGGGPKKGGGGGGGGGGGLWNFTCRFCFDIKTSKSGLTTHIDHRYHNEPRRDKLHYLKCRGSQHMCRHWGNPYANAKELEAHCPQKTSGTCEFKNYKGPG